MKQRYLEVTYRKGKPFAAYLYLPRAARARSVRTEDGGAGMRVDYDAQGDAIGVEITAPAHVSAENVSKLLERLGHPPLGREEWAPLVAA
jgi:uncharacterized protein YuzE